MFSFSTLLQLWHVTVKQFFFPICHNWHSVEIPLVMWKTVYATNNFPVKLVVTPSSSSSKDEVNYH